MSKVKVKGSQSAKLISVEGDRMVGVSCTSSSSY